MIPEDVRIVQNALAHTYDEEAIAALDRIEARLAATVPLIHREQVARRATETRLAEVERERDTYIADVWAVDAKREAAEARLAEVEKERAEAERLRLIEHRKDFDCAEATEARLAEVEKERDKCFADRSQYAREAEAAEARVFELESDADRMVRAALADEPTTKEEK